MFIYLIQHNKTKTAYVGQTVNSIQSRWKGHLSAARNTKSKAPLYQAIRQDGPEAFTVSQLATASSQAELDTLEKQFIIQHLGNSYNQDLGGKKKPCKLTKHLSIISPEVDLVFESRKKRRTSPEGYLKPNGVWMPSQDENCDSYTEHLRPPSRNYPWGYLRGACAKTHIAALCELNPVYFARVLDLVKQSKA